MTLNVCNEKNDFNDMATATTPATQHSPPTPGRVSLVGAGPGDPQLITVLGHSRLATAQVVVYDALANPSLLEIAPDTAMRIDVGKRAKHHRVPQDQINELLVEHAKAGRQVVRLKGGDPYLFGRGAEEVTFVASHGIEVEVVPGITSGLAAPMYAGIPPTHRDHASTITLVTGHEDPTKSQSSVDYTALATLVRAGGTLAIYMGVGRLEAITACLIDAGLDPPTPAGIVQWGTLPIQRSTTATLTDLPARVAELGITAPAIIVVGPVAGIDDPGLGFFTARPLFGQTIIVTRSRQQSSALSAKLVDAGANVIEAPTIAVKPIDDPSPVDEAVTALATGGQYDWLVLTSTNAVEVLADRLAAARLDSRALAGVKIACTGTSTAQSLWNRLRVSPDVVPDVFTGQAVAQKIIDECDVAGRRFLLPRGDKASDDLPTMLTQAGGEVTNVVAYRTASVDALPPAALEALRNRAVNWVTFTSSSTARNLVDLLGGEANLLDHANRASIGPMTSSTLRELGCPPTIEAAQSDINGLAAAIMEYQPDA